MHWISFYLAGNLSGPPEALSEYGIASSLALSFVAGTRSALGACLWPVLALAWASSRLPLPLKGAWRPGGRALVFAMSYAVTVAALLLEASFSGRHFPGWLSTPAGWALFMALLLWVFRSWSRSPRLTASLLGCAAAFLPSQCHLNSLAVILIYIAKTRTIEFGLGLTLAYGLGVCGLPFLVAWGSGALRRKK